VINLVVIIFRIHDVNFVLKLLNHAVVGNISGISSSYCFHLQGISFYGRGVPIYILDHVLKINGVSADGAHLGQQGQLSN
jgi:hypothetical protein